MGWKTYPTGVSGKRTFSDLYIFGSKRSNDNYDVYFFSKTVSPTISIENLPVIVGYQPYKDEQSAQKDPQYKANEISADWFPLKLGEKSVKGDSNITISKKGLFNVNVKGQIWSNGNLYKFDENPKFSKFSFCAKLTTLPPKTYFWSLGIGCGFPPDFKDGDNVKNCGVTIPTKECEEDYSFA